MVSEADTNHSVSCMNILHWLSVNWTSFVVQANLSVVRHAPLSCFTSPHVSGLNEPPRRPISIVGPEGVGLVSGGRLHEVGQDDISSLSLSSFIHQR